MALKSFHVRGEFSGRSTPIGGGPKISIKESWMNIDIVQRDGADELKIVEVKSQQHKRRLISEVVVNIPGQESKRFVIETRY